MKVVKYYISQNFRLFYIKIRSNESIQGLVVEDQNLFGIPKTRENSNKARIEANRSKCIIKYSVIIMGFH